MKKEIMDKFPTPNINDKMLLITHNDMDGAGCAILMKSIFPNVDIIHVGNKNMSYTIKNAIYNSDYSKYKYIFACDISCNEHDAETINRNPAKRKLILLDHHVSALHLNKYKWTLVQPEIIEDSFRSKFYETTNGLSSGTSLVYDYLDAKNLTSEITNKKYAKNLTHIIATYDTWDWVNEFNSQPVFDNMNKLSMIYGIEMFEEKMTERIKDSSYQDIFTETDILLLDIEKEKITHYLDSIANCIRTGNLLFENNYYSIVYANSNKYMAETFDHMMKLHEKYDLYIINYGTGISIRTTNPDINIGEMAAKMGGGGHPGAGGIKIPFDDIIKMVSRVINGEILIDI